VDGDNPSLGLCKTARDTHSLVRSSSRKDNEELFDDRKPVGYKEHGEGTDVKRNVLSMTTN